MKHGGDLSDAIRRHGGTPDEWLDLSTGINPWPWPVPGNLGACAWQRLPSSADEATLLATAREAYSIPAGVALVAAAGTQALIQWLPRLAAPGPIAILATTYDEHAHAWATAGHAVVGVSDLAQLPATARHVVVVNPNNPDGRQIDRATLARAGAEVGERSGLIIVDESFADVVPDLGSSELCAALPAVVLRSFGKFYGLAGLRLGFAAAAPAIAQRIAAALGPWPVSGPAIAIGRAALADAAWQAATRRRLVDAAERLDAVLAAGGLAVIGGTSLFRLVRHREAGALHARLARRHIWTRVFDRHPDLMRFGLPADPAGLDRLAMALADAHG